MRVLHLYSGNLFGGVERMLLTLARFGAESADHQFALCFEGTLSAELRATGAQVHLLGEVRLRNPFQVWSARRSLERLYAMLRPDAVLCHAPWSVAVFGPTLRQLGVRVAMFAHDLHAGGTVIERLARRVAPDVLLANSECTARSVVGLSPNAVRRVIHCPVPPAANAVARSEVRRALGTDGSDVVILQVSRYERVKGHLLHLEALARLKDLPGWRCWMVGGVQRDSERPYEQEVRARVRALGLDARVQLLGQRTDIAALLGASDIACQPNQGAEAFGISLVEALSAGRPVVATALGGALEIVDEHCGMLTAPEPEAVARALRTLIEDAALRERLGRAGPARAARLCDPVVQSRALVEALA